ncbi:MAG: hypothetical protein QY318_02580 [Candidatus Dojkabacteria bacterium]|nr:MAG: hypothetical protein QY318_02580 [Candidatus Dojkabacteria bacterium]
MKIHLKDFLVDSPDRSSVTKIFRSDLSGDIRGHLVILLSIKAKGKVDVNQIAPFIINGVGLGAKAAKSPIECLKLGLEQGERQLRDLIRHDGEAELGLDVNLSMVLLQEGKAYIGMLGSHEIRLYHDENLVDVTEILETNNVQTCSLVIKDEDYFVLSSSRAFFDQLSSATSGSAKELFNDISNTQSVLEQGEGLLLLSTGVDFEKFAEEYAAPFAADRDDQLVAPHNSALFDVVLTEDELNVSDIKEEVEEELEEKLEEKEVETNSFLDSHADEPEVGAAQTRASRTWDAPEAEPAPRATSRDVLETETEKYVEEVDEDQPAKVQEVPVKSSSYTEKMRDTFKPLSVTPTPPASVPPAISTSAAPQDIKKFKDIRKPLREFKSGVDVEDLKGKFRTVSNKTQQKLSPVVNKVGTNLSRKYDTVSTRVTNRLSTKYGRSPWFKRIMAKLSQARVSSGKAPGLRLGEYRERANRRSKFTKIALAFVIVALIFSGWRITQNWKYKSEVHSKFVSYLSAVEGSLSEAEAKVNSSPEEAILALFNAQKKIDQIPVSLDDLSEDDREAYSDLQGRVLGISDQVNKVTVLSEDSGNISLFADGRIDFDSKSAPTDIAIFRNSELVEQLLITDRGTSSVYRIPTVGGDVKKILDTNGVVKTPMYIDVGTNGIYIFDETAGVLRAAFGDSDSEITTFTTLTGAGRDQFEGASVDEFAVFTAADNLYVLSKSANSIFKSQRASSGSYGLPFVYYENAVLSSGEDLFADFNIYVITGGATGLNRYTFDSRRGALTEFPVEVAELRGSFENLTAGYTGADLTKELYLFDNATKRIIILAKPSEGDNANASVMVMQKQFEYRGDNDEMFENVSDIVVDDAEQFMYVLDGTKVWKITL